MGPGEKKVAAVLTVLLIVLVAVYFVSKPKVELPPALQQQAMAQGQPDMSQGAPGMQQGRAGMQRGGAQAAGAGGASCSTSGKAGPGGVATQEFGKKGAKVEIVAALPITHGCHVNTEAQLKEAYKKFPNDVHLTIYDLFGADGQNFVSTHGGQRAVVFIDGKTTFSLGGKEVKLEKTENLYDPNDIVPIVEQEVKKS